jgi:hypothetical protein
VYCVHSYLACPVEQDKSWRKFEAVICAGYVLVMSRKERPHMGSVCGSGALFNDGVQHGYELLCELHVQDGSGVRNFVRMTKSDFEILL